MFLFLRQIPGKFSRAVLLSKHTASRKPILTCSRPMTVRELICWMAEGAMSLGPRFLRSLAVPFTLTHGPWAPKTEALGRAQQVGVAILVQIFTSVGWKVIETEASEHWA